MEMNTPALQAAADAIKSNAAVATVFVGTYYDYAVYSEIGIDSRPRCTGAPGYTLVDAQGKAQHVRNFDDGYMGSFDIVEKTQRVETLNDGEKIYDELVRKLDEGKFEPEEKPYLEYLKALDVHHWDDEKYFDVSKEQIYTWLEVAQRIGEQIAVFKRTQEYSNGIDVYYFIAFRDRYIAMMENFEKEYKYPRDWVLFDAREQ